MTDFAKSLALAIAAPLATALGQVLVAELSAHREEQKLSRQASRQRWEQLIRDEQVMRTGRSKRQRTA